MLHVVVVSGAGASSALGAHGTPVAMMPQWATDLVDRLGEAANVLGLTPNMEGTAFEAAIGRYLTFTNSLPIVASLPRLGEEANLVGPGPRTGGGNFRGWYETALANQLRIQGALWQSLYVNFGRQRIDAEKAYTSYRRLHEAIRGSWNGDRRERWISHATTNFDPAIEIAIDLEHDRDNGNIEKLDGFTKVPGGGRDVWAPNLFNAARGNHDGYIPIMHLHGAVGWYFDQEGGINRRPTDEGLASQDTPALLLPDDRKDPANFPTPIFQIWEEFRALLSNASHVLFLGHSLHDKHLVDAVLQSGKPVAAVALTEPSGDGTYQLRTSSEAESLREGLPGVTLIPGKFGQMKKWPDLNEDSLHRWIERN